MPTIESKAIIRDLLKNNPQCFALAKYSTPEGKEVYNIQYSYKGLLKAMTSPGIRNWRVLWQRGVGLTVLGEQFLAENKDAISE